MNFNVRNAIICMATGLICTVFGVISGHAICAHQHVTADEQNRMLRDTNGRISYRKYIGGIFKDYKRVQEDPLGLNKSL